MVNSILKKNYFKSIKNTYNIKHGQVVVVWLEGQMKCMPVIDKCKVVVAMNVVMGMKVAGAKDTVVGVKDMVVVHKDMDMDVVDNWTLAVMVGQQ